MKIKQYIFKKITTVKDIKEYRIISQNGKNRTMFLEKEKKLS